MSNAKPDLNDLKLSPEILAFAEKLTPKIEINEANVANLGNVVEELLPAGYSLDEYNRYAKLRDNLAAGAVLALSNAGLPHLKKNADVDQVELILPIGKDRFEATLQRERTRPIPGKPDETQTTYGVITPYFTANGAVGSRGPIKKIRAYVSSLAATELSK